MSARSMVIAVLLAAVSGSLCACDSSSGRLSRAAASSPMSQQPSEVAPSTPVDLSTMSPADIGALALRLARAHRSGAMHLTTLNGAVAVIDVRNQYDLDRGVARADGELRDPLSKLPPEAFSAVSEDGQRYVGASPECYVAVPGSADASVAFEISTWLEAPEALLATMSFRSYDTYALRLHVTMPTKVAAMLVGAGIFAPADRPPLSALRGRVPAEIRLADDGSFVELYVEGTVVSQELREVPGIAANVLRYLPFVRGQATVTSAVAPLAMPPPAQLRSQASDCGGGSVGT